MYYVGRSREGRLAVAVASADKATGPYTDHGPLVSQEAGSIDGMAFSDQHGCRWLVWKEDGNSRNLPTPIWLQPLTEDGLKLTGTPQQLITNDAQWEGSVVEGPFIFFRDGWYYLFYAGGACCGAKCSYSVGVARARDVHGPWQKYADNPILSHNEQWRCPGHGSVVQDQNGRDWFLYHAYAADTSVATGREMMLAEVKWRNDGWPQIDSKTPSQSSANSQAKPQCPQPFVDTFDGESLSPGWHWPQDRVPHRTLKAGNLVLQAPKSSGSDLLGALLAKSCTCGDYQVIATLDVRDSSDEALAGIAAVGDIRNGIGLAVGKRRAVVWQRKGGIQHFLVESPLNAQEDVYLRLTAQHGDHFSFAYSVDGADWNSLGNSTDGSYLPPWDRNIRIALTVGNTTEAAARFEEIKITEQ